MTNRGKFPIMESLKAFRQQDTDAEQSGDDGWYPSPPDRARLNKPSPQTNV